ncbi:MAG: DUF1161 domain-containing protein [Morganella sp. (in: enterobacteria)]
MKKLIAVSTVLFALVPAMAQASCESVTEEISQKIISNGVPAEGFTLTVVPAESAAQAEGQVVGNCDNETQNIIYFRK